MMLGRSNLKATSALPLILGAMGSVLSGTPALANCTTAGAVTTCDTASPNPYTQTVGTGRKDHNRTVNVLTGASIQVSNKNAISVGDYANITLKSGSLVRTDATSGSGLYGTGPQPIEFNSYGTLVIETGAQLIERGTQPQAEAVNVHGVGNRIENHGLISGQSSAAIWFEDEVKTGPKNVVDNYGTIEQINGGTVIGTSGGSGIDFYNQTGAVVKGSLAFAAGDDRLFFFAGSSVTGNINGGGGTNDLVLEGALGTSDSLAGALTNFQSLTKNGLGRWTITGTLTGFKSTTVNQGTLALTGNNAGYTAGVVINPAGTLEARAQSLPTTAANTGNITNNGLLRFAQPDDGTYAGQIVGSGAVEKTGAGVTTLAPTAAAGNSYSGGTRINEGTIAVAADSALGASAGKLSFDGGALRTTATFSMARAATLEAGGGTFETTGATTLTETGVVAGTGKLTKTGTGTLALTGTNSYAGGTQVNAGAVHVSSNANLGAAAGPLGLDGGTLRTTASFLTERATTLGAAGGTIETAVGTLRHTGLISGPGGLTKTGPGVLDVEGTNNYAGGTTINGGILEIEQDANLGAAFGPLAFGGGTLRTIDSVAMDRATTLNAGGGTFQTAVGTELSQAGDILGSGGLTKKGAGTLVLTGDAVHTGGTTITAGTLQIGDGGTAGSIAGSIVDNAALVLDRADTLDVAGTISGTGSLTQAGSGNTRLAGNNFYFGPTAVSAGGLYVNGDQSGATGATSVAAGATLGGAGSIGGDVTVADGATLSPGDLGDVPGTLTVNGTLTLGAGSFLSYSFGQGNVPGGPLNDRTIVGGDLVLDGTLNVVTTPGGSFDPGVYRVFDYAGALTDKGLAVGTIPAPDFYVQTSVAHQVNLVNTTGLTLNFWDGDAGPKDNGAVNGGDGTWQSSAGNDNWTDASGLVNAPFSDGAFAIFMGDPGTVTVDNGLGAVTVAGMQFAVDGYLVEGQPITLTGPDAVVRVGDGSAAGAAMTATIAADLTGASGLTKTDLGTLVLDGAKTYSGDTAIDGGTLEIAENASLGGGALSLDGGTLRTTETFALPRATTLNAGGGTVETAAGTILDLTGTVSGEGALTKTGDGTLDLGPANSYAGGTQIDGGAVEAATNASLGAAAGPLGFDGGTLRPTASFTMDRATTIDAGGGTIDTGAGITLAQAGDVTGSGALTKGGDGTLLLTGTGDYAGGTSIAAGTLQLGEGGTSGSITGDVANDGTLVVDRSDDLALDGVISGSGLVRQQGSGTTTLSGTNSYAGGTEIDGGILAVAADANLGDAAGPLSLDTGTLRTTASLTTARATTLAAGGGTFETTGTLTHDGTIAGPGALTKTGDGTLVLNGANSYAGGTAIDAGTVEVAADSALGAAAGPLAFDGGTLHTTADISLARSTTLGAGGGTLDTDAGTTLTQTSGISGAGGLSKAGDGTVVLAGAGTWTGGTSIAAGTLQLGAGGTTGSLVGDVANDGALVVDRADDLTLDGAISGSGLLRQQGSGTTTLSGTNSYAGGTEILGGTLAVASDANLGAAAGPLTIDGATLRTTGAVATARATTLAAGGGTFDTLAALSHAGTISGDGGLIKTGAGTLTLSGANSYAGATGLAEGALYVNGDQTAATGATTAASGTILGGAGRIGGDVTLADGATLAPGAEGAAPGTLGIGGDLALSAGSVLDYSFGQANAAGGAFNDLTEVAGDLTLAGTLNVRTTSGGSFDPGVYRVISYGGALTNNGLAVGTIPSPGFFVQTSVAQQVNLVNTAGLTLTYWDGEAGPKNDGTVNGGDGTWQATAGNENWTNAAGTLNAPWTDAGFAIFMAAPGTVTVDGSLGAVTASGMQFASDGYVVAGDPITLVGAPDSIVRVGDGTATGAGITATLSSALAGSTRLVKTDLGTLILAGANSYSGGTAIDGGVLEVAADANLGAAGGPLSLDAGTLRTTADLAMTRATSLGAGGGSFETADGTTLTQVSGIAGDGALTKAGAGTMVMAGVGSYLGGTTIAGGVLQVGDGGTSGSIAGDVANEGTLAFDRADDVTFAGAISGTGSVRQQGAGTTTLTGANAYTGPTGIAAGTLAAGAAGALSAGSAHTVAAGAVLDLAGFDQTVASLSNAGRVTLGSVSGTRLAVAGDYVGQGGILHFTTTLGGDDSVTDRMTVAGNSSGDGVVEVTNDGGLGAQTVEGIKLIDVAGTSGATFTLAGDTVLDGRPVVIGGAFAYSLWQGGVSTPTDGDWYLRSSPTAQPGPPQVQPGVPIYETYTAALLALNGLPTMQQRIGNRYWNGEGNPPALDGMPAGGGTALPGGGLVEDRRAWARVEGRRVSLEPDTDLVDGTDVDMDVWQLQVGMDRPVKETDDGVLVAGLTFDYGTVSGDVGSDSGDGSIDTTGYGFGGSLTWLRDDNLYVDGQAQLMWFDSDLASDDVDGDLVSGNDGFGYALGVEAGKRIPLKKPGWTVTPQAQVVYSSVSFDDFEDTFGVSVESDDGASMPVRLGLSLDQESGWKGEEGDGRRTHFYGIANVYYDLIGDTKVVVGDTGLTTGADQAWGSVGVGGTYSWGDGKYAVYGEGLVSTSLSNFGDSYANAATAGFRIAW